MFNGDFVIGRSKFLRTFNFEAYPFEFFNIVTLIQRSRARPFLSAVNASISQ